MSVTAKTTRRDLRIARLLTTDDFRELTCSAVEKMLNCFRDELATSCSSRTALEIAQRMAQTEGAAISVEDLITTLQMYPEIVVLLMPGVIANENWAVDRSVVCFVGNQIMFGIEQAIERAECLLAKYQLPTVEGPRINSQFSTAIHSATSPGGVNSIAIACRYLQVFVDDDAIAKARMDYEGGGSRPRWEDEE